MVWAIIETPFEPLDHGADIKRATLEHPKPYAIADLSLEALSSVRGALCILMVKGSVLPPPCNSLY